MEIKCGACKLINHFIISLESTLKHLHIIRYTECERCRFVNTSHIMMFNIKKFDSGCYLSNKSIETLKNAVNNNFYLDSINELLNDNDCYRIISHISTTWRMNYNAITLLRDKR